MTTLRPTQVEDVQRRSLDDYDAAFGVELSTEAGAAGAGTDLGADLDTDLDTDRGADLDGEEVA